MVVVAFRSRVRPENAAEFYKLRDKMFALAKSMPGFISYKSYASEDGERLSLHEWDSAEHLRAWREHPEHRRIQELGRERYYEEYTLYALDSPRESRFKRSPSR